MTGAEQDGPWWEREIKLNGRIYFADLWEADVGYAGAVYGEGAFQMAEITLWPLPLEGREVPVLLTIFVGGKRLLMLSLPAFEKAQFAVFSWLTGNGGLSWLENRHWVVEAY